MSRRLRAIRAESGERKIQQEILQLLDLWQIPAHAMGAGVRSNGGARHVGGAASVPDILGFLPWGQALAIEVKGGSRGYGLRPGQARWIVDTARRSPFMLIMIATSCEDVRGVLAPIMAIWTQPDRPDWPLGEVWARMPTAVLDARLQAVAAAEQVLAKERARPRPGVPAPLL